MYQNEEKDRGLGEERLRAVAVTGLLKKKYVAPLCMDVAIFLYRVISKISVKLSAVQVCLLYVSF